MKLRTYWMMGGILVAIQTYASLSYLSWEESYRRSMVLQPPQNMPYKVEWSAVDQEVISDWILAEGTIRAVRKAFLTFEVDGKVTEIGSLPGQGEIREGMQVKGPENGREGQLIARLMDKDYAENLKIAETNTLRAQRGVEIARAQLEKSERTIDLAQVKFDRIRQLRGKKVASQQQFDEAQASLRLAEAELASDRAELAAAKATVLVARNQEALAARNLERTKIRAPWDGRIARLNIRQGKYVSPDALSIADDDAMAQSFPVVLIDDSEFEVAVEIPVIRHDGLRDGQQAFLKRQQGAFSKTEVTGEEWHPARVHAVAHALSPDTRTLRVTLRSMGEKPALIDGERVSAKILRAQKLAIVVPVEALLHRDNQTEVFVVSPTDWRVSRREVETGIREGGRIEILSGLSSGEQVVTQGRHRLTEGDQVILMGYPDSYYEGYQS